MTHPGVQPKNDDDELRTRDADGPIVDTLETTVAPVARDTVNDGSGAEDERQEKDDRSLLQKARDAARTPD